jgi:acetylornithine deacetylase
MYGLWGCYMPDASSINTGASRVTAETERVIAHAPDLLRRLVRQSSTYEDEHSAVELVEGILKDYGYDPHSVFFPSQSAVLRPGLQRPLSNVRGRRNLVVKVAGSGGGKSIVLSAHLDTVSPGDVDAWTYPPLEGTIVDGKLYGRGAFDDKAGVAIILCILDLLRKIPPLRGDLIVHFVLEDETTGNGSLYCIEAGYGGDAAVILDGTRLDRGINQFAGNVRLGITMHGRPAAVSVSHVGVNAAELLVELMLELRTAVFARNQSNSAPWTQFPSPNQFSIEKLDSLGDAYTVPTIARGSAFMTFTPPTTLEDFRQEIDGIVTAFAERKRLERHPELDWNLFGVGPTAAHSAELEDAINASASRAGLARINFGPSTGTSDMRHFLAHGIPCVLYGPGVGQNPHRANEYYELSSFSSMIPLFFDLVRTWAE